MRKLVTINGALQVVAVSLGAELAILSAGPGFLLLFQSPLYQSPFSQSSSPRTPTVPKPELGNQEKRRTDTLARLQSRRAGVPALRKVLHFSTLRTFSGVPLRPSTGSSGSWEYRRLPWGQSGPSSRTHPPLPRKARPRSREALACGELPDPRFPTSSMPP